MCAFRAEKQEHRFGRVESAFTTLGGVAEDVVDKQSQGRRPPTGERGTGSAGVLASALAVASACRRRNCDVKEFGEADSYSHFIHLKKKYGSTAASSMRASATG